MWQRHAVGIIFVNVVTFANATDAGSERRLRINFHRELPANSGSFFSILISYVAFVVYPLIFLKLC